MRLTVFLLLCGLAGCQTVPSATTPQAPPPTAVIRLCQHDVPADVTAIRQELMQHVVPGMPVDAARGQLEALGLRVFGYMPKTYRKSPNNLRELVSGFDKEAERQVNRVEFRTESDEVGAWGQRFLLVRVVLYFDVRMTVTEVEVPRVPQGQPTPFAWYFARRPELREPLGMSIEQARTVMEAAGFRCTPVASDPHEKSGRPYLDCHAMAETPLGGSIIRVRLFRDAAGTVTDSFVLKEPGVFDGLLCMLPNRSDTPGQAVLKAVVFPVRLYTAIVVAGLEADLAMGRP